MCLSLVIYSFDEMVGSLKRIRGREEKNGLRRVLGGWAAPSNSSLFVASQIQLSHDEQVLQSRGSLLASISVTFASSTCVYQTCW
jgi:hypothetical protein